MVRENRVWMGLASIASRGDQLCKGSKMNNLNSVLIEGTIINGEPVKEDGSFRFWIMSDKTTFEVQVASTVPGAISELWYPHLLVRVIGRLERDPADDHVFIRANYVEIKDSL